MWYLIIGLIVISIIYSIFSKLSELVGGPGILITIIVVLAVAYFAFSWVGVLAVIGIAIGLLVIVGLLGEAGHFIGRKVDEHDQKMQETARINQETQTTKLMHDNDHALLEELNRNCFWLGYMNAEKWKKKLPNFVDRVYSSSFEEITLNFARQIEQQHIVQNNDWFEPYKLYILNNNAGTVSKMLNEVDCPQLKMTHCTPDRDLINTWMMRGTERVSMDVPELFECHLIKDMNENLFTPTKYLKNLYGVSTASSENVHREDIDINDL